MRKFYYFYRKNKFLSSFILLLLVLSFLIYCIISKVLFNTSGIFMYPFDDTFIHLKIAGNLVKGNWGINSYEFASASSSILYTLILALCRVFSNSILVPFVINCLVGIIILLTLHSWLEKQLISYAGQTVIIFLVVLFSPLPLLIISGMEHTLQCLFSFLFIFHFSDWLEETSLTKEKLPFKILFFAILVSTIRYEGLFLIAIACVLLLLQKKLFSAVLLGFVSLLPVVIFGFISISKGNYFLPNSVLIKSGSFNSLGAFQTLYNIIFNKLINPSNGIATLATQRLLIIFPLLFFLFRKYLRSSYRFILIFLFSATVLQLSFASTGYLYRYEAYLFFCLMIIAPLLFYKYGRFVLEYFKPLLSKFFAIVIIFFLLIPVVLRGFSALDKTSKACINIYDQQYQMAKFIKQYHNNDVIALNDIGAISYFTNAKIIDLWGLATIDVTKSKKQHYWTSNFLDSFCKAKQVKVAIIYDAWFTDSLTSHWSKTATWQIQNNVICGDDIVSFYSLEPSLKVKLQQQLKEFEKQLPTSVRVQYY